VHCWADLQSVHGFRCYDNIHICKLIAYYTANAYNAEREMSASACPRCVPGYIILVILLFNRQQWNEVIPLPLSSVPLWAARTAAGSVILRGRSV